MLSVAVLKAASHPCGMRKRIPSSVQRGRKDVRTQPVHNGSSVTPPRIDPQKCIGCGLCADVRVTFEKRGKTVFVAKPELCTHCGQCGSVRPACAILDTSAEVPFISHARRLRKPLGGAWFLHTCTEPSFRPKPCGVDRIPEGCAAGAISPAMEEARTPKACGHLRIFPTPNMDRILGAGQARNRQSS